VEGVDTVVLNKSEGNWLRENEQNLADSGTCPVTNFDISDGGFSKVTSRDFVSRCCGEFGFSHLGTRMKVKRNVYVHLYPKKKTD
jgi:hypothetical protein